MNPVLTAKEWASREVSYTRQPTNDGDEQWESVRYMNIGDDGTLVLDNHIGDSVVVVLPESLPAVIALANHTFPDGHPMKITWVDVEACLSAARHWKGVADRTHEWDHRDTQYKWERRASKIAAYLPPQP